MLANEGDCLIDGSFICVRPNGEGPSRSLYLAGNPSYDSTFLEGEDKLTAMKTRFRSAGLIELGLMDSRVQGVKVDFGSRVCAGAAYSRD